MPKLHIGSKFSGPSELCSAYTCISVVVVVRQPVNGILVTYRLQWKILAQYVEEEKAEIGYGTLEEGVPTEGRKGLILWEKR